MASDPSSGPGVQISQRFRQNASLAPFSYEWSLMESGDRDFARSFEKMGQLLGASQQKARVHFGIRDESEIRSWSLDIGPTECAVSSGRATDPDLEVLLDAETWWQIASGALSPLAAFGTGHMRIIGDLGVARRIARRVRHDDEGE